MTVQEAKESIEYLKMQLTEDLEMICFTGYELKALDMSIQALEELEQYRSLGTVEELKEAMDKQVAKKPKMKKREHILHYECPSCGFTTLLPHCGNCGQKLDWEEGGTSD